VTVAVVSLLLSLGWMWHGRDRDVYAPKFHGDNFSRYVQGVNHFRAKMGLEEQIAFAHAEHSRYCAFVDKSSDRWPATYVYFWVDKPNGRCERPEIMALHEACHERYAHLDVPGTDAEHHAEVKACMKAYSEESRR
jgi:hypothetical protein